MKISLITSTHFSFDDRIYHHMAISLLKKGHEVQLISSFSQNVENIDENISNDSFNGNNLSIRKKIYLFIKSLSNFNPSIIICSEPLTVIAAAKYRKISKVKIIYDITEFYPSKKNIKKHSFSTKWFHFFKYLFFDIYAQKLSDAFIFGEYYKSIIPKFLYSRKPNITISYYPKKNLFPLNIAKPIKNELNLCYSGPLSIEKGFVNFVNVIKTINKLRPTITINIKIIGNFVAEDENLCKKKIERLKKSNNIEYYKYQPLFKYIDLIKNTDIFIDLRSVDFENTHCLPIKLFYYIALERPIIFSNLRAIKKEINIKNFGYLVNPKDSENIAMILSNYCKNSNLYLKHCKTARNNYSLNYNWQIIENNFLIFTQNLN